MTEPASPRSSRWADILAVGFVMLAVGFAGWALRDELPEVLEDVRQIAWWRMVLALACVVGGLLATAEVWKHCLSSLGRPVSTSAARQIFFPAQVGKYVPGSVWPFLAQMRFAREQGVPGGLALLAGSVFLVVHAVTSLLVASLLLISQPQLVGRYGWVAVGVALTPILLHPRVVNLLARKLAARSGVEPPTLRWRDLVRPLAWMMPAWFAYGLAAYLLAAPFSASVLRLPVVCIGSYALGWSVGLLVFMAPAGLGAREAVLILALTPSVGVAAATTVSLILRLCHTVADMLLALRYGLARARTARTPAG